MRLDLNRASQVEIEALPGVGPALAARIVAHRAQRGPFRSAEELRRVPGISERTFAGLRDLVEVRTSP